MPILPRVALHTGQFCLSAIYGNRAHASMTLVGDFVVDKRGFVRGIMFGGLCPGFPYTGLPTITRWR